MSKKQDEKADFSERELEIERHANSVRTIMSTKPGRRYIYGLLCDSGVFLSSANRASFRTNETFFHEGQRNIGNRVMQDLELYAADEYLLMIKENRGENYER